ncbi:MAG: quinol:cytochrome C oxidoreductase [Chitinophagales bacterium]|nr:quinol:cytochrome C oxidoreductase [Chitinophagales bacterium]
MSNKTFTFGNNLKKWAYALTAVGVVGMILSFFFDKTAHHNRFWANLLLNTYYFAGIAVTGVFFITAHQLGYGGWHTVFKKIPIAMSRFLFVAFILFVVIVAGMWIAPSSLYSHWADPHHVDSIVSGKSPFLTRFWYTVGVLGFFGLWALFAYLLPKNFVSIKNWKEYSKAKKLSAAFLLIFGVSSSILSWWVIMSLDPHWYSTLFGWYNLASYICAGLAMMILIIIGLKQAGYMPKVHIDHIHDLGKLMFGFSIFWTYLWFSQFMLIWYANVPEATVWFNKRFDVGLFKFLFYATLVINFLLPLLALMSRDAKRKMLTMAFVSVMVIFGHYLDFFYMVMYEPMAKVEHAEAHGEEHALLNAETVLYAQNTATETVEQNVVETHAVVANEENTVHADAHGAEANQTTVEHGEVHGHEKESKSYARLGLIELMFFAGFLGIFLLLTFTGLDGQELEIEEDPFLKESLNHHI